MARVLRRGRTLRLQLRPDEVDVLNHLADELGALLGRSDVEPDGDSSAIAGVRWPGAEPVAQPEDPALRRLLPDGYRDDPEAAADFRRYTDATLRDEMDADLVVVRADLVEVGAQGRVVLSDASAAAWLRVLNRLRLVLATRLGIETAADHEALEQMADGDPRAAPYLLFEWIGFVLSDLLRALR